MLEKKLRINLRMGQHTQINQGLSVHLSNPEPHTLGYSSVLSDNSSATGLLHDNAAAVPVGSALPSEPNHLRQKEENETTTFITEAGRSEAIQDSPFFIR